MKKFELMALPYADNALEPVISKETIGFHHGKHLLAYVNNLNGLLEGSSLAELPLEEIVKKAEGGILNNAGQILNHELYFGQFTAPKENNKPIGRLADAIVRDFGSFEAFKEEFQKKGATLFGSGWVWLSADADSKLVITQETNAANPCATRPEAPADLRCLGTRLLSGLPEPPSRPPRSPVEDCQLGGRGKQALKVKSEESLE